MRRPILALILLSVAGSFAPEAVKAELHDAIHDWARSG